MRWLGASVALWWAWPVSACPALANGETWRVRSVRPRTPATQALVGARVSRAEVDNARRSFDAPTGSRFSITVTVSYLERCEAGEADLVFRTIRLRLPRWGLGLTPALNLVRARSAPAVNGHREWAGGRLSVTYAAAFTGQAWRHTGSVEILGEDAEMRLAAGNDWMSARLLALGLGVWKIPLVPAPLRRHPELGGQVQAALSTAESVLRLERYARDPAFQRITRRLAEIDDTACLTAGFQRRLTAARQATGGRLYGLVDALLAMDPPLECAPWLPALRGDFGRIDRATAAVAAAEDMARIRDLVDRLLYRLPLVVARPVAIGEAARSRARVAAPGVGAGVRVSLFGWLDATAGYVWDIGHRPGTRLGAPFVEMRFRDPFR